MNEPGPAHHRTVDRVTQIVEQVVYQPGITFAELARALDAPKSSVHGFIRGLLATGWLYEEQRRFYLGPAVYGLTLASGQIRAGMVTQTELDALHDETGRTAMLGVEAGSHLFYVGESGMNALTGFAARSNIRRELLVTAGGKAILADYSDAERDAYLRRKQGDHPELVADFLGQFPDILNTGVASNIRHNDTQLAQATLVRNAAGERVAVAILVGPTESKAKETKLRKMLIKHVTSWTTQRVSPREAI